MAYDIERYLAIQSAGRPSFGPNGQIAFLMDTTGVSQVWCLTGAQEWPQQLTFHPEPVTFASFSPTRDELVYGMDDGGNERWQLFRLSDDGSEVVNLTHQPDAIHHWGGWSHDGEYIAYTANRRSQDRFDGYVQHRDDTDANLVIDGSDKELLSIVGWSPDDERLLAREVHSNRNHDLYCFDRSSSTITRLTDQDREVRYPSAAWGPDGESIYVTTDWATDTLELATLDPETGNVTVVYEGGNWNVSSVHVDHDSRTLALARNVEGYTDLSLFELDSDRELQPLVTLDRSDGVLSGPSFGPDGERLAVAVSAPTVNTNVFVFDWSGSHTQWTDAATAGIPPETFRTPELVRFDSFDGLEIPAFLTLPGTDDGPYPAVVDIHGGPEAQRRPSFRALRQYFVDNGYAVFEPNVRGSSGYGRTYVDLDNAEQRMDAVTDIKAGVEWLTDREEIDGSRVVALGGSYGGFMVLASLTEHPELWAAGVDIVGIANLVTFLENTGPWRRRHREAEYGSLQEQEFLESISPINSIENISAPLFVLHGENDPRVPVGEAEQIATEASEHVPTETLIFEDEGHGISKLENRITAYQRIISFLNEHVS
ncbi:S9 family peptidase [Halocatena pleomorpha]|uniref:S9 family peptidase n=1 Tax=Halocatena pleomorpha TaxID=1785090 RepID=A0A3P3RAV3_9EURY|nr:S9 family peptidase [Halocatena pleomorpha]RRJ30058.1 S9 family peptidase [Halocatena pleomorpha]